MMTLLLWWAQMYAEPAIAENLGNRFDHVLVDEDQDTNRLQASILPALKPDGRGQGRDDWRKQVGGKHVRFRCKFRRDE